MSDQERKIDMAIPPLVACSNCGRTMTLKAVKNAFRKTATVVYDCERCGQVKTENG